MSTEKTFTLAGVSTLKGETKIRFANDATRVKVLIKNGHTDIDFIDLPSAMNKAEIAEFLIDIDYGANNAAIVMARDELYEATHPAPKAPKAVKATKVTKAVATTAVATTTATVDTPAVDLANVFRPLISDADAEAVLDAVASYDEVDVVDAIDEVDVVDAIDEAEVIDEADDFNEPTAFDISDVLVVEDKSLDVVDFDDIPY